MFWATWSYSLAESHDSQAEIAAAKRYRAAARQRCTQTEFLKRNQTRFWSARFTIRFFSSSFLIFPPLPSFFDSISSMTQLIHPLSWVNYSRAPCLLGEDFQATSTTWAHQFAEGRGCCSVFAANVASSGKMLYIISCVYCISVYYI